MNSAYSRSSTGADPGVLVPPNPWTACLYREQDVWHQIIARGGLHAVCCPAAANPYGAPPWIAMPPEGRRFQKFGNILVSAFAGENIDTEVFNFEVPTGYEGVIVSIIQQFVGNGFVEGSGDIHWRIRVNRRWVKDYGDTITSLGTTQSPCYIYRGGIRLYSKQLVSYFAMLGTGATGRLDPNGRIITATFGWFYPM